MHVCHSAPVQRADARIDILAAFADDRFIVRVVAVSGVFLEFIYPVLLQRILAEGLFGRVLNAYY